MPAELLPRLVAERGDLAIVQVMGQRESVKMRGPFDFLNLLVDLASVCGGDFELLDHCGRQGRAQFGDQCFT